jgi:hypothetical protein
VTTPGGVPNLPPGALTVDNLEVQLQDTSAPAVRNRAAARMPGLFNNSNGGNPASDLTPFGILTKIFAAFNSSVANADPNDIQGPEDLPGLLWEFIENLPVIGELVGLGEAILGNYDGDDAVLLAIQDIFQPIRRLLQLFTGQGGGFPTKEELEAGWDNVITPLVDGVSAALAALEDAAQAFAQVIQNTNGIGDLLELLSGKEDGDTADAGTKWLEQQAKVRDTIDNFVRGLGTRAGSNWNPLDVFDVASTAAKEASEMAAGLALLNADAAAQYVSGKSFKVTVAEYGGIPPQFTRVVKTGAGGLVNDGDTLEWQPKQTGSEMYVYNEDLLTDYFETSIVVPRQIVPSLENNYQFLLGRCSPDGLTRCLVRWNESSVRFGCINNGGAVQWFGPDQSFKPGTYMTFRGGVEGADRVFQMLVGNLPRAAATDTAGVSQIGAGFRRPGFGFQSERIDSVDRLGNLSHFTANDNRPPPTKGIGAKIYRSNPAGATDYRAEQAYPLDVFDSVGRFTTDNFELVNLQKGQIRVLEEDFYDLQLRAETATLPFRSLTVSTPRHYIVPFLKIDGADGPKGQPSSSAPDGFANTLGVNVLHSVFIGVYLTKNQIVEPWFRIGTAVSGYGGFQGDAGGWSTWFSISKSGAAGR